MAVFFSQKSLTLTPNDRQALALWEKHAQAQLSEGLEAWETPPICSWGEFTRALWDEYWMALPGANLPAGLMNEWQERFLWLKVLKGSKEGQGLLNLPQASKLAQDAWRLVNSYLLESELKSESAFWSADTQVFLAWVSEFQRECQQRNWLEPSSLESALVDALDSEQFPLRLLPHTLSFSGFAEWTPAQKQLLQALEQRGVQLSEEDSPQTPDSHRWRVVSGVDRIDEIRLAARWLRDKLEQNPGRRLKVGLVVPDLAQRRSEVHRILLEVFQPSQLFQQKSADNLAHDLSAGLPFSHWRIVKDALDILSLWRHSHPLRDWNVLLTSPYLGEAAQERAARSLLWTKLVDNGRFSVERNHLERLAHPGDKEVKPYHCPELAKRLRQILAMQQDAQATPQTPGQWAEQFALELDTWGWPGDRKIDSVEYQTLTRWKKLLAQFGSLDQLLGPIGREEALQTLRRVSEETVYQPKVSVGQIEVMGTLEAVGLRFDYLWLAGFHDGNWPSSARPNPYLPFPLQARHSVAHSTPERELEFARRVSRELLAASPIGVVSYPQFQEDQHCRPSPLFSALTKGEASDLHITALPSVHQRIFQSRLPELFIDPGPPKVPFGVESRGGSGLFKHQAACPFRAFALLRLNARPLEMVKEGLDARQRGNLLHTALEELWKDVKTSTRWSSMEASDRDQVLQQCAEKAVFALKRNRGDIVRDLMQRLEVQRVKQLLSEWMEIEETREPFEVLATEERVALQFADLNIQVTIDRVDQLKDGSVAVLDYKTGSPRVRDWLGERPHEPQLPLYCVSSSRPADLICFATLKPGQMGFHGLGREDNRIPGVKASEFADDGTFPWPVRLQHWRQVLDRLATEFRAGNALVDPVEGSKTCRNCGLQPLCRVEERRDLL